MRPGSLTGMDLSLTTPSPAELAAVGHTLDGWLTDDGPVQLHPGDLGWYSMRGATSAASALRVWNRDGRPVAIGLLDEPDLLRLALDPAVRDDAEVATRLAASLQDPGQGVLDAGEAAVECRGASALVTALTGHGWEPDDPWTPLVRDLTAPVDAHPIETTGMTLHPLDGANEAEVEDWVGVHHSAFKEREATAQERAERAGWWHTMDEAPFGERHRSILGRDSSGEPVAVVGVWSAGEGRPGLVEPMGVSARHRGRGYGVAICVAAAAALREMGASSAMVCAESASTGALRTYAAAGFAVRPAVCDMARGE